MTIRLTLTVEEGALQGQEVVFAGHEEVVIGRAPGCPLRLDDVTVSRQHCMLDIGGEWAWVRDLGSLNGTFVNGQNIGRRPQGASALRGFRRLHDGDELRVGSHAFRVGVVAEDPAAEEAVWQGNRELCETAV